MDKAHEPNSHGYAGEGTVSDDELEDTAESISLPVDDLTPPDASAPRRPPATEARDEA